jgi:hypothetical protein
LRASVDPTEAANEVVARFGVVGPNVENAFRFLAAVTWE